MRCCNLGPLFRALFQFLDRLYFSVTILYQKLANLLTAYPIDIEPNSQTWGVRASER
jgi:hypothetical protein